MGRSSRVASIVGVGCVLLLSGIVPAWAGVQVQWVGPDAVGLTPQPGIDYLVTGTPANILLQTTEVVYPPGSGQTYAVELYRILSTDADGFPADLGAISTAWIPGSAPHNVIVELGLSPSEPVRNVTSIVIDSQDNASPPATWSSIRVFAAAITAGPVKCVENALGEGGRLSGGVSENGSSKRIDVFAIGRGAAEPGAFFGGAMGDAFSGVIVVDRVPAGSTLAGTRLGCPLFINDSLAGDIELVSIDEYANLVGALHILGTGVSTGNITLGTGAPFLNQYLHGGEIHIDQPGAEFAGTLRMEGMRSFGGHVPLVSIHRLSGTVHVDREDLTLKGTIHVEEEVAETGRVQLDGGVERVSPAIGSLVHVGGSVAAGGTIEIYNAGLASFNSRVEVLGDLAGTLIVGAKDVGPALSAPVNGQIVIGQPGLGGDVSGTILQVGPLGHDPAGRSGDFGSVTIHGHLSGQYIQQDAAFANLGSIDVAGDVSGSLMLAGLLDGSGLAPGQVSVGHNVSGSVLLWGGMLHATLLLNTAVLVEGPDAGAVEGLIEIGNTGFLVWTDNGNVVELDDIHIFGAIAAGASLTFTGCFDAIPAVYALTGLVIDGLNLGVIVYDFCPGATVTVSGGSSGTK